MSEVVTATEAAIPQGAAMPEQAEIQQQPVQGPEQAQPEVDPEFPFVLPTGEKFRTVEDLMNAKVHATEAIRQRDEQLRQFNAMMSVLQTQMRPQATQPAQSDPVSQKAQVYGQKLAARGIESPELATAIADILNEERQSEAAAAKAYNEYVEVSKSYPELSLDNPLSKWVHDNHKPQSAMEHLGWIHYYQAQQAGRQAPAPQPPPQPYAPAPVVQTPAFVQQPVQRQQQFSRPASSAAPSQRQGSDPPELAQRIQQALNFQNLTMDTDRGKALAARIRDGYHANVQARTTGGHY